VYVQRKLSTVDRGTLRSRLEGYLYVYNITRRTAHRMFIMITHSILDLLQVFWVNYSGGEMQLGQLFYLQPWQVFGFNESPSPTYH
jgi:hypothetical protein